MFLKYKIVKNKIFWNFIKYFSKRPAFVQMQLYTFNCTVPWTCPLLYTIRINILKQFIATGHILQRRLNKRFCQVQEYKRFLTSYEE